MTTLVANTFDWIGLRGIANWFKNLGAAMQRRRMIRTTINELSQLTDYELQDMGITRGDIHAIAHGDTSYRQSWDAEVNENLKGSV